MIRETNKDVWMYKGSRAARSICHNPVLPLSPFLCQYYISTPMVWFQGYPEVKSIAYLVAPNKVHSCNVVKCLRIEMEELMSYIQFKPDGHTINYSSVNVQSLF